jgi:SPASM domain peptide maturase of grasp-with-spasm system
MIYFKQFSNCIVSKGTKRSLICDLQRQFSEIIPNDLVIVLEKLSKKKKISELYDEYGKENKNTIEEYLEFLVEKEYGFYCDSIEFDMFTDMDLTFITPSEISNAIIELRHSNFFDLENKILQLENLGCNAVAIVLYECLSKNDFIYIIKAFKGTRIKSLEVTCKFDEIYDINFLKGISAISGCLTKLTFMLSPFEKFELWDDNIFFDRVWIKKDITSFKHCGIINTKYFNTNLPKVIEAINHNSCLNRKISIDVNGDIKNCPSMPESYGNIKNTTLEEAINKPGFKKYRNITKDDIEICRDCEFRYVCTDCRAYTERTKFSDEGLDLSKPLKCGYNPYTNEWAEWSTNPLKEKAIEDYGMKEIIGNDKK